MAVAQQVSEREYVEFVLSHPDERWELHAGVLVEKPGMSWEHLGAIGVLVGSLYQQLDLDEYVVFVNSRVRQPEATVFLPDIAVVPVAYGPEFWGRPGTLAIFSKPLPLIIEVWSKSTGDYDVDTKVPIYQRRGDAEIWRLHPYEHTLTRWIRQSSGSYVETVHYGGVVELTVPHGVEIDLDRLFTLIGPR
jgi:Uma2 family endonuclease